MRLVSFIGAWLAAFLLLALRATLRFRVVEDARIRMRQEGQDYVLAMLHAHQLAGVLFADEPVWTMVSRSRDGGLVVPLLKLRGIRFARGSTSKGETDKGGREALEVLRRSCGADAILLTVDGPRGPRGTVHPGVVRLSDELRRPVVPVVAVPTRRWTLSRTWDRLQIPKPFSRVDLHFGDPLMGTDLSRESVQGALFRLEQTYSPEEARFSQ